MSRLPDVPLQLNLNYTLTVQNNANITLNKLISSPTSVYGPQAHLAGVFNKLIATILILAFRAKNC